MQLELRRTEPDKRAALHGTAAGWLAGHGRGRTWNSTAYLPTHLTTREVAAELFLPVNTVGTHGRRLYAKLDVHSRHDAVNRARSLGLLAPSGGHLISVMRVHLPALDHGLMDPMSQARAYLRHADPVLARLIDDRPDFDPRAWMAQLPPMDLYGALVFQVTGQQLSVAATRRTLARIQALFGGHLPAPAELLAVEPGQLRQAGLSWRKIGTLRDLAERMTDGRLDQEVLSTLPDDELMAELTAIPGIGPWTVQGALIIALGREDVVLPGDLALRKAVRAAYELDHLPTQQEVLAIAENWRPYRSLATSYLFSAAFEPAEAPPVAGLGSA